MATEIPHSSTFAGLTRAVIAYGEQFEALIATAKQRPLTDADWAGIEQLVDVAGFERVGMFLTDKVETCDWATYKGFITQYGGFTDWDGKLRRITEKGGVVIQELEERNTRTGQTDVSNTVTVFEFSPQGKVRHLDVYVAHLETRPAR